MNNLTKMIRKKDDGFEDIDIEIKRIGEGVIMILMKTVISL